MTTINGTAQTAAQTTAAATTKTEASRAKLTQDYDSFLKLLTTQMQNQDPLSPMESTEFTNQLVQFSQVEQQISQNDKLEKLLTMQTNNQTQASLGFIGLDVEASGNAFTFDGSTARMSYTLPETSTSTAIQIKNEKGVVVRTLDGSRSASRQELTWDGKRNDGSAAPAGNYTLSVVAPNADGKLLTAKTSVYGRVSGIESGNGNTTLLMGNVPIRMEDVVSARQPTAAAA
ncbi:flagellar hook assembly protein FlgD [Skermanella pratensis]|uniref:flagellar hook assembly protein FlgD n=1 Tax=Skermanella pratensis TaxID=2233999 RepID=UPI001300CB94|nr:flagellar hook assembly protein FlgD [Skermanella pratensis]